VFDDSEGTGVEILALDKGARHRRRAEGSRRWLLHRRLRGDRPRRRTPSRKRVRGQLAPGPRHGHSRKGREI
jgi:hypothetical protein